MKRSVIHFFRRDPLQRFGNKTPIRHLILAIAAAALTGCGTPITKSNPHSSDQLRFEQEQAGYPDRHNSAAEAQANRQHRDSQMFKQD